MPVRRRLWVLAILAVWLVGWGVGEGMASFVLLSGRATGGVSLGLFLLAWTLAGGVVLWIVLLMIKGREILILRPDVLIVRRELFGLGRTREYELRLVKRHLRFEPRRWNSFRYDAYWFDWSRTRRLWGGPIVFDYGPETVRVANGVRLEEAEEILRELRKRD